MEKKILVCYKSVTGFTKRYGETIAREVDCDLMDFKSVTPATLSQYDILAFGGRFHAGMVDGLKKMKSLVAESGVKTFVVYATGAMPDTATETIKQAWENNLTPDELRQIPHFYMPGGLCYEKMPFHEKMMMKAFAKVMKSKIKRKEDKTEQDRAFEQMISTSYDLSSQEYVKPLVDFLKGEVPG